MTPRRPPIPARRGVRFGTRWVGTLVIVVDQFEEVFSACSDEFERTAFVDTLVDAATDLDARVSVVITIRADFYGRCSEHPALAELLAGEQRAGRPDDGDEYRRAIEQPALRVGVHVEPALTEALVAEVGEERARPAPSTALLELWSVGTVARSRSRRTSRLAGSAAPSRGSRRRSMAGSPPSSRGWPGP